MFTMPTVDDFKSFFTRDFPFGTDINENVLDADIERALNSVECRINQALFCDQKQFTEGFLNFAAHQLVTQMQASSQGLSGSAHWIVNSRSVGSVSESYSIPQSILDNPVLAPLSSTTYGLEYITLILPNLVGPVFVIEGATQA